MKKFIKSNLSFWLFCFAVALVMILGSAGCATQKHEPNHYPGYYKQRREYQQRRDNCRELQIKIQNRGKNR